ncbi:MAG: hypothetical protein MJ016_02955 [Victivallaceae bacterium]|nr:hypothetical protein [Victivallaceae bacterium]
MGLSDGCCCGVIAGFVLALFVAVAAVFGIYCYTNPDAKDRCIVYWEKVKSGGDQLVRQIPEPEK